MYPESPKLHIVPDPSKQDVAADLIAEIRNALSSALGTCPVYILLPDEPGDCVSVTIDIPQLVGTICEGFLLRYDFGGEESIGQVTPGFVQAILEAAPHIPKQEGEETQN